MQAPTRPSPHTMDSTVKRLFMHTIYKHMANAALYIDAQMIKSKLDNHGETCLFMGYANDHAGNIYQIFNPQTKHSWITCDTRWIKPDTTMETKKTIPLGVLDAKNKRVIDSLPIVETAVPDENNDEVKIT